MHPDDAAPRGSAARDARKRRERDALRREGRLARDTGDPRWGTGGMPPPSPDAAAAGPAPLPAAETRPTSRARRVVRPQTSGTRPPGAAAPPSFAGLAPRGWRRKDERVRDEVCDRFTESALLDPREVDVGVREGRVTLLGAVPTSAQRRLAEDLAWAVPGVVEVENRLDVREAPGAGAGAAAAPQGDVARRREPST